jgi:hypothetical protein
VKRPLFAALLCTTMLVPTPAAADPFSVLAAAFTSFGPGATIISIGGFSLGQFGSFLFRAALGLALNALTPKPDTSARGPRGYQVTAFGAALDHPIIYGETKTGAARVFDASTGTDNRFLHRVLVFAGHEVQGFTEVYLNDYRLTVDLTTGAVTSAQNSEETTGRFNDKVRIIAALGSDSQGALPQMVAEIPQWTSAHRLQGLAYLYVRFDFDADVFPNGIPEITATVRGRKVFDPRTGVTAWSSNPALCIRDYLTADFGLSAPVAEIDDVRVAQAANICDEIVEGERRFSCNGTFTTAAQPADIVESALTSMGGLFWHAQGKWRVKPAYYTTPVLALTDDDLRSPLRVRTRSPRRENFNTVRGKWRGAASNWQETDYKPVSDPAFVAADGGQERAADIDLPFTTSHLTAQRIARIALRQQREQIAVSGRFGLRAFAVQVGDVVQITNSRLGWVSKTFEVVSWTFTFSEDLALEVQMSLRETSPDVFTTVPGAVFESNNTTLPSPYAVPTVSISPSQLLQTINEEVIGVLRLDLASNSPFNIDVLEVEIKRSNETVWRTLGQTPPGRLDVPLSEAGNYDIRARARNTLGVRGPYATILNYYFGPFEAPPAQPTNFVGNVIGGTLHLSWSPVADLDLSHYRISYSPAQSGASVSDSVVLVPKLARPGVAASVPAQSGTYFLQAVDKLGIIGRPASFVVAIDLARVQDLNVVEILQEDPAFTGSRTDVAIGEVSDAPALILGTSLLFDDADGNFDDAPGLFDAGLGTVLPEGMYEFSDVVDLSQTYISRVSVSLRMVRVDYADTFDLADGLFDDRQGLFDGDSLFADVSARVQVSYTDDDPLGTPVWTAYQDFTVGDISARAFRFRAILTSDNPYASPAVVALSAEIDMPDRVEAENDITFTGTRVVTFPSAFKATPALGVALANLADGQRYVITNKTRAGFTIQVLNTGGGEATNPIQLDYVAKGYGRQIL